MILASAPFLLVQLCCLTLHRNLCSVVKHKGDGAISVNDGFYVLFVIIRCASRLAPCSAESVETLAYAATLRT